MANGEFISARISDFYVRAVWESTPDTAANASTVTLRVYAGYFSIQIGSRSCTATCAGSAQSATAPPITHYGSHQETEVGCFTFRVSHSADGSAQIPISAAFPFRLTTGSGTYIDTLTASGTAVLDTIARAAQVTAADVTLPGDAVICFTPAALDHTFSLTLSLGQWQETVQLPSSAGSIAPQTHRIPLPLEDIARQLPTSPTGQMTARLTTCQGETALGTTEATFALTLPQNELTAPTIAPEVIARGGSGGAFLQGISQAAVTYNAAPKLGATIVSATSRLAGMEFTDLSPVLTIPGAQTLISTVTDSRGFTATAHTPLTVWAYAMPYAAVSLCERRGSDLSAFDPAGTALYLQVQAVYTDLPETVLRNEPVLQYRLDGGDWVTLPTNIYNSFSGAVPGVTLALDSSYRLELRVIDAVTTGNPTAISIPTAHAELHLRRGGGAAFGKYAQREKTLDIAAHWALQARGNRITFGDATEKEGFTCALDTDLCGHRLTGLAPAQADTDAVSRQSLFRLVYPVGSIYLSFTKENPALLFGGTWQPITDCLLWASSDAQIPGDIRNVNADETGLALPAMAVCAWHRTA